jgi:2-polyprenyl-3-methyl-5-hydroxy-6-metoxy-1,4-benzoquinol methylase
VLGVSRASLYRALWACSGLHGHLGNAFLYFATGLLRAENLDAAARGEWIDYSISNEDVDAGLSRDERQFYTRHLRPGDRVLIVGCGAGRDLLALHRLGYHVDGLDHSDTVIDLARKHLARHGLTASVRAGAIQSAALDGQYDVVIFSDGCYSLIRSASARTSALTRIGKHLAPRGRVLISYHGVTQQSAAGLWMLRTTARAAGADWSPENGDVFWRHRPGSVLRYRHHFTQEALAGEIDAAGFCIVEQNREGSFQFAAVCRAYHTAAP